MAGGASAGAVRAGPARLNWVDRLVTHFSPVAGARRLAARTVLASYEAAKPSHERRHSRDKSGPNTLTQRSAAALRDQVRHLERNHDLVRGAIDTLVDNIVGASGLGVEFQPRRRDGTIHAEYAAALAEHYREWCQRPEVTQSMHWARVQRLLCRTWVRDGEGFAQHLVGQIPKLTHGTRVPYSLELMEPDLCPLDYEDRARGISQGVQVNAWGRRTAFLVYRRHPGEILAMPTADDLKTIPAERMLHLAQLDRIGQLRGVTRFASVITRLEDIKDYEESERVAAKVAAMLTAYVKRLAPAEEGYTGPPIDPATGQPLPRYLGMQPGQIIDTLAVGEDIGLIDSKRPNPNLLPFRQGQLKAAAAAIGISYSSFAKSYDGTFSAQRQELVEQWVRYACLTDDFAGAAVLPVVRNFIMAAHLSGVVRMPADLQPDTWDDVLCIAPSMPWIDPLKEANAWATLIDKRLASEVEVIRRRGGNPQSVLAQIGEFQRMAADAGVALQPQQPAASGTAPGDEGAAADDAPAAPAPMDGTAGQEGATA